MFLLRETTSRGKLQRLSQRPRPHDGKIPRGSTQRVQFQAEAGPKKGADTCNISQHEKLRQPSAHAGNGQGAGRNKVHTNKHGKVHLIFTGEPEIHRQLKFYAEQPREAGKGERRVPVNAKNSFRRKQAAAAAEERNLPVRVHGLV